MPFLIMENLADYNDERMAEIVSGMLEASGLELRGKKVLVNPNLLGPFTPDSAVVTHPSLIRAVRQQLRSRGCEVIVGDNPGIRGYGMVGKTAKVSGAGEAAGDDFLNLTLRPRQLEIESRFTSKVSISSEVLEADILISLPKLKTHMATILTGAVKNSYGFVVGADKTRLHAAAPRHEHFGQVVADIYSIRPPDLVIMDAVIGMEGNGPSGGRRRQIGYLMASDSGGAMDLAMCHMTGIDPSKVATQRAVTKRGLAPSSMEEVDVRGEIPALHRFRPPTSLIQFDPWGLVHKAFSQRIAKPQIKVDKSKCTACAACARSCPANVIEVGDYPSFDFSGCISCYCCYEMCPERALQVGRMMRFVRHLDL